MGSGEWGVGSGEWGVGSGEWGVVVTLLLSTQIIIQTFSAYIRVYLWWQFGISN
ncbi:MAG: hypothetical protein V7K27_13475 [Nostoc sp.]|uniref:hypothetical protein n=1 Tax=Nostoc sp. TaxID=1180 RepID=UPI002FF4C32C